MVMMGRTAEALFWIGRYTERTENHARLIDVYYHIREERESGNGQIWSRLIDTIGDRAILTSNIAAAPNSTSFNTLHLIKIM